jgi:predicted ATPase
LLIQRRKQIHERAGQALESIFAEQLDDHLSQLAHHYSHSDNVEKAIVYLGRAGQQALQRSAHTDAVASFRAAIDLLQRLPESTERNQRELLLQLVLGVAFGVVNGWASPQAERAFSRTRELCKELGDPPEVFPVLHGLWGVQFIRGDFRKAYELAKQLLPLAEKANDSALMLYAHFALGETSVHLGEFLRALQHLEMAMSLYDRDRHHPLVFRFTGVDAGVTCTSYLAQTLWTLGYPDQALKQDSEAVALAHAVSHPQSLAAAECFAGILHQKLRGNARVAQEMQESVISLSAEHGLANWLPPATIMRGGAIAEQGRHKEGIALMQEGLAALRATGAGIGLPYYLCLLAVAHAENGNFKDGLEAMVEALKIIDEGGDGYCEPETYRLEGEVLLKQNGSNARKAQVCFERAIEIAREQSAKSYELRATTSLARLLGQQGRRDGARTMLADIYNWFTEGFATADLKDAKALLDELSN